MSQIATLTVFKFQNNKGWGFAQMGQAPRVFSTVAGLRFFKLMGCGRGLAFSIRPDFSRYAFFGVWDDVTHAQAFMAEHPKIVAYQQRAELRTFYLRPLQSKGSWDGKDIIDDDTLNKPFLKTHPIAVLTRATLRLASLPDFWRQAPSSTDALETAQGLKYSIGMGELPFLRQATFSVWDDEQSIRAYAYNNESHKQVIKMRKEKNWYSEELFARFEVIYDSSQLVL